MPHSAAIPIVSLTIVSKVLPPSGERMSVPRDAHARHAHRLPGGGGMSERRHGNHYVAAIVAFGPASTLPSTLITSRPPMPAASRLGGPREDIRAGAAVSRRRPRLRRRRHRGSMGLSPGTRRVRMRRAPIRCIRDPAAVQHTGGTPRRSTAAGRGTPLLDPEVPLLDAEVPSAFERLRLRGCCARGVHAVALRADARALAVGVLRAARGRSGRCRRCRRRCLIARAPSAGDVPRLG